LMLREAFATSVVLLINEAIPVPDPPPDTDRLACGLSCWYCSAQARAKFTIVSEPILLRYSVDSVGDVLMSPARAEQAVVISNRTTNSSEIFGCIQMIIAIVGAPIKEFIAC
jgi:hypothetical protein